MADWDFAQWLKMGAIWLVVFAMIGGIVSQTSAGVSGRGFFEGMWKGVEIFAIVVVGLLILWGVLLMMGMVSTALNT